MPADVTSSESSNGRNKAATKRAQTLQSQKDARELASGRKREEFDRITGKGPSKTPELDRPPAPSGKTKEETAKAEQEKKAEARRAKLEKLEETKKEITHDAKAEQEKEGTTTKRKDTFRAFRDMADEATREKEPKRKPKQKDESKTKGKRPYRAFRDMAEDRDRDRERDDDQGIERTPKKKPPTPPKNDR